MRERSLTSKILKFSKHFKGEIKQDRATLSMYAVDASIYRILPQAVAYPVNDIDLQNLVLFASHQNLSLIPRAAGTSLGGQCVGEHIIVDICNMNAILEVNEKEQWVRVQPGVVRDELNIALRDKNLFFGPNTSTSSRAMIGGMVGNNSCGSYSIKYGTTRDNVISIKGFLSDASEVEFGDVTSEELKQKNIGKSLENAIYRQINFELSHPLNQESIRNEYPKPSVTRRNTGYALDILLDSNPFVEDAKPFNMSNLVCGSEGTLMLFSEIKLKLHPLPTDKKALICAHFDTLRKSLEATVEVMYLKPSLCELMDKKILDCTKGNIQQEKNRFFVNGDPEAILMIEVEESKNNSLDHQVAAMKSVLSSSYAAPVLKGDDIQKALALRASGLGVLQNLPGDKKSIEFVEDTAVAVEDLPDYIDEFEDMMRDYNTESVYYAHAGAGELHIRPILNLKEKEGQDTFYSIANSSALLVKKYNGSLSGEHGDGIIRSEFVPVVLGKRNFDLIKRIKETWDPKNIFNPNKIVNPLRMDENINEAKQPQGEVPDTFISFSEGTIEKAIDRCTGSADCRNSHLIGGTLCPSYQAVKNERYSTRARAHVLNDFIKYENAESVFQQKDIKDVLDMCLSCKACLSECPSSVDMAAIKAEFQFQYYKTHPRTKLEKQMAAFFDTSKKMSKFNYWVNTGMKIPGTSTAMKSYLGIDKRRSLPAFTEDVASRLKKIDLQPISNPIDKIYLYIDEFINFLESDIGIKTIELLHHLDINVTLLPSLNSARSFISKGYLEEARVAIDEMVETLDSICHDGVIVGIEPSCILGMRDDFLKIASYKNKEDIKKLAKKSFIMNEYLANIFDKHPELKNKFSNEEKNVICHCHCHQKSLGSTSDTMSILNFPENCTATEIKSGCCGMAGSFGYEHYDMSMKIGNLVLFPTIKNKKPHTVIAANGTSCRHQIKDGTGVVSLHPVEILHELMKKE